MKSILALTCLLVLASVPAFGQSACYVCHANHGDIWQGSRDFHEGGVGHCSLCHVMHNSQDGDGVNEDTPSGSEWLLIRSSVNDLCLTCHAGMYGNVFGQDVMNPPNEAGGGNFVFLLEDNLNDGHGGAANPVPGRAAGHNIASPAMGVSADDVLQTSPGGTFRSEDLTCTSCHDPHGNGNFRMLNGLGDIQDGLFTFDFPAPDAAGLSIYHGHEGPTRHTAYRSGMSLWCGNCHLDIHGNGDVFQHPIDVPLGIDIAARYNGYNGTTDIDGGSSSTAYIPQVPFEDPDAAIHSQEGPTSTSVVMCMTCHRAHASSSMDAGRWDFNVTRLVDDGMESESYPLPSPYPDGAQRSLCNKCHGKDEFDDLALK